MGFAKKREEMREGRRVKEGTAIFVKLSDDLGNAVVLLAQWTLDLERVRDCYLLFRSVLLLVYRPLTV